MDYKIIRKGMAATPVEILGLKYPLCKGLIDKISNKWQQRTKKMMTKWPAEGTFDVALCKEMETLIKNHKTKGNSKKRETKNAKEKEVLALFKKEGENSLKSIKQVGKILKQADQETKKKEELFSKPPPYLPPEGQFPILKDTVEVSGEMQMEGQIEFDKKLKKNGCKTKEATK